MTTVRKAIFPVAGQGTRFLPATKAVPKEMLPLIDRPLIDYAIEEARDAGIEEFIFVTAPGKEAIEHHLAPAANLEKSLAAKGKEEALAAVRRSTLPAGSVKIVHQNEPLGLGHAVWCARDLIHNQPFAVLLPDDVIKSRTSCLRQLILAQSMTGGNMIAAADVGTKAISSYGCFAVCGKSGRLSLADGMVEKPDPAVAPSTLAAIGRYILQPQVMAALDGAAAGSGGEIQLTDAISSLGDIPLWAFEFEGERFDCGSKLGFMEATMAFGLDHPDFGNAFAASASYRMTSVKAA